MKIRSFILISALFMLVGGCFADKPQQNSPTPSKSTSVTPPAPKVVKEEAPAGKEKIPAITKLPAPKRLVAIGDVHGDIGATRGALKLAGAIDAKDTWIGGDLVVVQTGDQLDRGDDEQAILDLLTGLQDQAREAGGALVVLNGNHEVMNVQGDLRYVTPGGFEDFKDIEGVDMNDPRLEAIPEAAKPRAAAFLPGTPYAKVLATRGIIAVVGDSVFVHGGVLPEHVRYGIDTINAESAAWMRGERPMPAVLRSETSPIWSRHFSAAPVDPGECALLKETLDLIGAKRMVVGHTRQRSGITSACDGQVWRIDTGMAAHYGGQVQVLEITAEGVKPLKVTTDAP